MSFTPEVYERIREGAKRSAARIVPVVHKLVKPHSVIDVGCGEGWFARAFVEAGVEYVVGVDETVEDGCHDGVTFKKRTLPTGLVEDYDLAVCLEVAEHLPEGDADHLVRSLCECAKVVLFSAAIPNQGGLGHVNEQWPSYWRKLFSAHDYSCTDALRWVFWDDVRIEPWYRQNLLLFAPVELLSERLLKVEWHLGAAAVVHPDIYGWRIEERDRLHRILYAPSGVGGEDDGTVWNGP